MENKRVNMPGSGSLNKQGCFHLVGVGGVGMSALAQLLLACGHRVTGSDRAVDRAEAPEIIQKLRSLGVVVVPQDGLGVGAATTAVVVSTAVEQDNPDLTAARRLGLSCLHRVDVLAELANRKSTVAVSGTAGKTTVTGMLGWILAGVGEDPTVVNGGEVLNWRTASVPGNFRSGSSDRWVVEADESDESLLKFRPDWAVVTNVSKDHFEVDKAKDLFGRFEALAVQGDVSAVSDPSVMADFEPERTADGTTFTCANVTFRVNLPGLHNARNAWMAVRLCERLGLDLEGVARALETFAGIHRRLERVGCRHGVTVMDDYAHNPEKIRAAWSTLASHSTRVLAVWRPHGYGPLKTMWDELVGAFSDVTGPDDCLVVLPVFDAGGTADRSVSVESFTAALCDRKVNARAVESYNEAVRRVCRDVRPGDIALVMGARDPGLPGLARALLDAIPDQD